MKNEKNTYLNLKPVILLLTFFIFHFSLVFSQDHLVSLHSNSALTRYARMHKAIELNWRQTQDSIVDTIPFLDDFSKPGPYPDAAKWMDNAAFINTTYPICPHTIGVATLDGLNNEGLPYNPYASPNTSLAADSLTSRPIDLSKYVPFDSIYLSFYYQSGGRSPSPPLFSDTLLLQFKTDQVPWTTVWFKNGYLPSATDTGFHMVLMPITADVYFTPHFQFRFKNYACTSANVDQWNIDEVYMAANRSINDTSQVDVAFVYEAPSLLANYQYMPWEQFTQKDLKANLFMYERYNSANPLDTLQNTTYTYTITTMGTPYNSGGFNFRSFYYAGYNNYNLAVNPPVNFTYTPLSGPTTYTITHLLSASPDFDRWNDTLRFEQLFSNYYAYDDGTSEAAYFINGLPNEPVYLAYGFTLNKPDTLLGLYMSFDYFFTNSHSCNFRLAVWDNSGPGGTPGVMRFEDDSIYSPIYSDSLNGFVYYPYHFHKDTAVNGTIYVGLVQTTNDSLDIGFDLNTNSYNQIYYNLNDANGWYPGSYQGSMLMRPVFGENKFNAVRGVKSPAQLVTLYPNPATDEVTLTKSMAAKTILKIYGIDGRKWLENDNFTGDKLNTSTLPSGIYILEINPPGGNTCYEKLFIQK